MFDILYEYTSFTADFSLKLKNNENYKGGIVANKTTVNS